VEIIAPSSRAAAHLRRIILERYATDTRDGCSATTRFRSVEDVTESAQRRQMPPALALALSILGAVLVIAILAVSSALIVLAGALVFGPALLDLV
jgi:hypothetical protein